MTLNQIQCRAARALLGWSQAELAYQARVAIKTVADFERGMTAPHRRTLAQIAEALEDAGVQFLNGGAPGVQLTPSVAAKPRLSVKLAA
jgi:transcriptional regulator with XRE-family HTH domain